MSISIGEAIKDASLSLREAGVPEPRREAGSLLAFVIRTDRTFLISHSEDLLQAEQFSRFREVVERRSLGEPLQYITGLQDFYGREFRVSKDVLIPRPETELLVESALLLLNESNSIVCDVGTGSGCIAVTMLCERPDLRGVALDVSEVALEIALQNALRWEVQDRLNFAISDCFDGLAPDQNQFDLIVSNPPYVSAGAIPGLQREVKDHEPRIALSPGPDGLAVIRRLIQDAPRFLRNDGYLLLEIGFDQGEAMQQLVDPSSFELIEIRPDLQGIPRIVILRKSPHFNEIQFVQA
jgi:release factor glutamine methyltransferase